MKRLLILAIAACGATICLAQTSPSRTGLIAERGLTAADFPQLKKLAENIYVWSDLHPTGLYTTNNLIVITTGGVLVADGQKDAGATKAMVDRIRMLTSQPIVYVVVASEHSDHTGGNVSFPSAVTFVASPYSKNNLEVQARQDRPGQKTVIPTETVSDRRTLRLGDTDIQILYSGRAHTGGDLEVYLPSEKVLFVSEVFSNHLFPQLRAAVPTEWIETLRKVQHMDAKIVVPGHGFVDDPALMKEELAIFERVLEYIVAEGTRLHSAGLSVERAIAQVNWGPYAAWPLVDRNGATAVQRVYEELDGRLK